MHKIFDNLDDQTLELDACDKFLEIFTNFLYDESVDSVRDHSLQAQVFFRDLPIYMPLLTEVRNKIRAVNKMLENAVEDGFKALREKSAAENVKGVCV